MSPGGALGHNKNVKDVQRQTIIRRSNEPKLEIGDVVQIKEGVVSVVVARYVKSVDESHDVHYIVELKPDEK
jgi:hypothetical protein